MKYRIIVTQIDDYSKKHLIARHIAKNPQASIGNVIYLLEHLPAHVLSNVEPKEAEGLRDELKKISCTVKFETDFNTPEETLKRGEMFIMSGNKNSKDIVYKPTLGFKREKQKQTAEEQKVKTSDFKNKIILLFVVATMIISAILLKTVGIDVSQKNKLNKSKPKISSTKKQNLVRKIRTMEKEFEANPGNFSTSEKITKAYKQVAQQEESPSKKIEYLSKAIRMDPQDKETRKMISDAFVDTANNIIDDNPKIRFLKMAISFNKYNMSAWDSLIVTYERIGDKQKETDAIIKREEIFGCVDSSGFIYQKGN